MGQRDPAYGGMPLEGVAIVDEHTATIGNGFQVGVAHELGSVSKVLTAIAVLRTLESLDLAYDDRALLVRGRRGRLACSVRELLQHRSGLPRLHASFRKADPADPYAHTTVHQVLAAFEARAVSLRTRILRGSYVYSNFGYAAVGHRVAQLAGVTWPTVADEALEALGISEVWTEVVPQSVGLAPALDAEGAEVPWWSVGGYAPAGGVRASAAGLETLCRSIVDIMRQPSHPLHRLMWLMVNDRWSGTHVETGLGWMLLGRRDPADPII